MSIHCELPRALGGLKGSFSWSVSHLFLTVPRVVILPRPGVLFRDDLLRLWREPQDRGHEQIPFIALCFIFRCRCRCRCGDQVSSPQQMRGGGGSETVPSPGERQVQENRLRWSHRSNAMMAQHNLVKPNLTYFLRLYVLFLLSSGAHSYLLSRATPGPSTTNRSINIPGPVPFQCRVKV